MSCLGYILVNFKHCLPGDFAHIPKKKGHRQTGTVHNSQLEQPSESRLCPHLQAASNSKNQSQHSTTIKSTEEKEEQKQHLTSSKSYFLIEGIAHDSRLELYFLKKQAEARLVNHEHIQIHSIKIVHLGCDKQL